MVPVLDMSVCKALCVGSGDCGKRKLIKSCIISVAVKAIKPRDRLTKPLEEFTNLSSSCPNCLRHAIVPFVCHSRLVTSRRCNGNYVHQLFETFNDKEFIILPVVLYGYETWSFTSWEEAQGV